MKCGLLGEKLGHSYSPRIHAELADYEYVLYEKKPEEVEAFVREGDWHGLNVTIPYKKTVIPFCDELTELAEMIGSVNTLLRTLTDLRRCSDKRALFRQGRRRWSSAAEAHPQRSAPACGIRGPRSLSCREAARPITETWQRSIPMPRWW